MPLDYRPFCIAPIQSLLYGAAMPVSPAHVAEQLAPVVAQFADLDDAEIFTGPEPLFSMPMTAARFRWSLAVIGWSVRTCIAKAVIQAEAHDDPLLDVHIPLILPMSKGRLRFCLAVIGWSQRELGRRLRWSARSARRLAAGGLEVSVPLAVWLETLMRVHHSLRLRGDFSATRIRRAIAGEVPVPDCVALWIDGLTRIHQCLPLPVDWRGKAAGQQSGEGD